MELHGTAQRAPKLLGAAGDGDLTRPVQELQVEGGAADTIEHWLGPGRTLTLARYELFLMAARDSTLRAPLVQARERFVAAAAERVGATAAPTVVAALDGLILDALIRGGHDPARLREAVAQITGTTGTES